VWKLHPVEGCFDTRWLTGLWFTKAEVEGVVLKAEWHWGSDSSDVNHPLGKQFAHHCTYAFLPREAPWTVTVCFFSHLVEELLFGDSDRHK